MFTRIVVPYDHSPLSKKALETAMMLLNQDKNTEIDVIAVVPVNIPTSYYASLNIEAHHQEQMAAAKEILDGIEQKLNALPNKSRIAVLEGNPAEAILEYAEQNHADLIVMGSRGLSNLKELFLGSVSHYVVQKASCPVFIIK